MLARTTTLIVALTLVLTIGRVNAAELSDKVAELRSLLSGELRYSRQMLVAVSYVLAGNGGIRVEQPPFPEKRADAVARVNTRDKQPSPSVAMLVDGVRYTIFTAEVGEECWINFAWRPNGTYDHASLSYVNANCNGKVDNAWVGKHAESPGSKDFNLKGYESLNVPPLGLEYETYWQSEFERVLDILLPVVRAHSWK